MENLGNILHGGLSVCQECGAQLRRVRVEGDITIVHCRYCGIEYEISTMLLRGPGHPVADCKYDWIDEIEENK